MADDAHPNGHPHPAAAQPAQPVQPPVQPVQPVEQVDQTERGVERLIFFTDAVAAIAITLLILPLVEIVASNAAKDPHATVGAFFHDNLSQIFAFALSFIIIARLWISNHGALQNTVRTTPVLMWLDIAWAFTIVVIPLPTEITAVYRSSLQSVELYISASFASTLCLALISFYLYKHPELERRGTRVSAMQLYGISVTGATFIIAAALELAFPILGYYVMFALFLSVPADWIIKPRIRRREAARLAAAGDPRG